jgi:hypothetical protein
LGEVAWDVLQRIVREILSRRQGGHLVEADLRERELRLPLPLRGTEDAPDRFAERLVRSIEAMVDEAVEHAAAFRPGRAYCHRCVSASCEHTVPPSCRHVFVGYGPTGSPRWADFAQLCLDLKHPEVDRLYDQPPAFLTLVQDRATLHAGILDPFRNEAFELMGQVCAGFFTVSARAHEGRGVLALTIQAAETRGRGGRRRLGLNLLGRTPGGEDLDALWERHDELPWRPAVHWAQSALDSLAPVSGRSRRLPGEAIEHRVSGIMRGLARRLERDRRARARRTRHAEDRHASGQRPTRKALDDAREAGPESMLVDERRRTVVVLGDRGRTHFFTADGQHVSSVRYSKEAIARKIKLETWRQASTAEIESLRQRLPG